jgi:hypothetical protein
LATAVFFQAPGLPASASDPCKDNDGDGCGGDLDGNLVALSPTVCWLHKAANVLLPMTCANK